MHNLDLIFTLAAGLFGALTFGYFTHRMGWSPIVGYLLAGVLVGPHTPGFVADKSLAGQLAEVGVILLMFGVGLHFHLKDLLAVKRVAILGAVCQSSIATLLGAVAGHFFGWGWKEGVVYGLALSVASTVVLIRVLSDNGQLQSPTGRIAVGWLVVEDLFTVFALVLLPVLFVQPGQGASGSLGTSILIAAVKLTIFVGFMLYGGGKVIPWVLEKVAASHSRELFTLSVLAIALGIAAGSAYFFDVSMALGAFLAGMVVGQSDFSARAGAEALPMRDAFAVMFFLSVGMLFDPAHVLDSPMIVLATLGIVLFGKPLAALVIVALLGYSSRVGLGVAISLAQIGEFSFLLATLGRDVGVLPEAAMNPLVGAAILSIMINPLVFRTLERQEAILKRFPRLWRLMNRKSGMQSADAIPVSEHEASHRAVVVGYGPIGQAVTRLLKERGIEPTVIEMNIATYNQLRSQGVRTVYGDANQREVLEHAGIAKSISLILSSSAAAEMTEAIRIGRDLNPDIHVVTRAGFLSQAEALRKAGANEVFSSEGELALAITQSILRQLGATPDQLGEEEERLRAELLHSTANGRSDEASQPAT